jgi:hypothetical protein
LNFEIDVAKQSINKQKDAKFPEENRWLKWTKPIQSNQIKQEIY